MNDTQNLCPTFLRSELSPDVIERLKKINYVVSDADGTMFTSGKATVDSKGKPSARLVETLCRLRQAGISVIPCTGRNRAMIFEDARILGLPGWIAEMGGVICSENTSHPVWTYYTADMEFDQSSSKTPHDIIWETGVIDAILKKWPGKIETYHDNNIGYEYREVTVALRGTLPEDEVQAMLDACGLPLYLSNNGFVRKVTGDTTLICDRDHPKDIHTYHIMPRGLTKGSSIKRLIEICGWNKDEVLGAGDSPADIEIAKEVGLFLFMKNGLDHPEVPKLLKNQDNIYLSTKPSTDGWIDAMELLLEIRS